MSKKGPSTRVYYTAKDWLRSIRNEMSTLAKNFDEERYQAKILKLKQLISKKSLSDDFHTLLLTKLRSSFAVNAPKYDDASLSINARFNDLHADFINTLVYRACYDLQSIHNITDIKKEHIYDLWFRLYGISECFSDLFIDLHSHQKNAQSTDLIPTINIQDYLTLYNHYYAFLQRYYSDFIGYLPKLPQKNQIHIIQEGNRARQVEGPLLFRSHDSTIRYEYHACHIWARNGQPQRFIDSYQTTIQRLKELEPIENDLIPYNRSQLISLRALLLLSKKTAIKRHPEIESDLERLLLISHNPLDNIFEKINLELTEIHAALKTNKYSVSASQLAPETGAASSSEIPTSDEPSFTDKIKVLISNISTSTESSGTVLEELAEQSFTLLSELRINQTREIYTSNFSDAMRLIVAWMKCFNTNGSSYNIDKNRIRSSLDILTQTLKIINAPKTQNEIIASVLVDASKIPASTDISTYADLARRYSFHFNQIAFIANLFNAVNSHTAPTNDEVPRKIDSFENIAARIDSFEKRVNIYQFILTQFLGSTRNKLNFLMPNVSIEGLNEFRPKLFYNLWLDLNLILINIATCFKFNLLPNEQRIVMYQRAMDALKLIQTHSQNCRSLIQSIDQKGKMSPALKAFFVCEKFSAEKSFVTNYISCTHIALKQGDLNNAIAFIAQAYQNLGHIERKLKLSSYKDKSTEINDLSKKLIALVMQIYSPHFQNDEGCALFGNSDLSHYQSSFTTPEQKRDFAEAVRNYIYECKAWSFLPLTNCQTQMEFVIATYQLLKFYKEISPFSSNQGLASDYIDLLSIWEHLNQCAILINNMPTPSAIALEYARNFHILLIDVAKSIFVIIEPALFNNVTSNDTSWLNSANNNPWQFYYSLIQRHLQYCQLQATHHLDGQPIPEDLEALGSFIEFFKKHYPLIAEKSKVTNADALAKALFNSETAFRAQLKKTTHPLVASHSKAPNNKGKRKTKTHQVTNRNPVNTSHQVPKAPAHITEPAPAASDSAPLLDDNVVLPPEPIVIVNEEVTAEPIEITVGVQATPIEQLTETMSTLALESITEPVAPEVSRLPINVLHLRETPARIYQTSFSPYLHLAGPDNQLLADEPGLIFELIQASLVTQKLIDDALFSAMVGNAPKIASLSWRTLSRHINGLFRQAQEQALSNLIYLTRNNIISYLFSVDPAESHYYALDNSYDFAYWKSAIDLIYANHEVSFEVQFASFMLSLRLAGYMKQSGNINFPAALDNTATLLSQKIAPNCANNDSLLESIRKQIGLHHLNYQSFQNRQARPALLYSYQMAAPASYIPSPPVSSSSNYRPPRPF